MQKNGTTQQQILAAALSKFASRGYAGTSVQDIVDAARVTKPTLYYYFANKVGLYQALVDSAHDERYRLMQEAVKRGHTLKEQLVEILTALFDYALGHRELMRVAFATAFAAAEELPKELDYTGKCKRSFEFMHSLIKQGLAEGMLDRRFNSQELATGFHGSMNVYVISHLLMPECTLDRRTAERVVQLFLDGAAAGKTIHKGSAKSRKP
ncbi:MAG: transcriptional regulator, TetR family [Pedosphaera sp.]|nr:transcriptional regulator, TetR family [Pedosphaera sp.]